MKETPRMTIPSEHRAEVYRARDGWRYRIIATGNGRVIAASEAYSRKWSAKRAVRKNHPDVRQVLVLFP